MSFVAKYDGRCGECSERISEGDHLEFVDGGVVHLDCVPDHTTEAPARPTCAKCWQILSVSGACGCDDS